jgi:hypothetical protein
MAATEKEYMRLPGSGRRRQGLISAVSIRSRLWLGKDHLLSVDSQYYSEDYKRFYFRDVQAVIIRKTRNGAIGNVILGFLLAAGVLGFISTSGGPAIFWAIFAGFWIFGLLLNTAFGPTCVSHLRTAVQTDELPSLKRLRRAQKVLARLRPLIAQAQGEIPREEIPAWMAGLSQSSSGAEMSAPPVITAAPAPPSPENT